MAITNRAEALQAYVATVDHLTVAQRIGQLLDTLNSTQRQMAFNIMKQDYKDALNAQITDTQEEETSLTNLRDAIDGISPG